MIQKAIDALNEAFINDPAAIIALMCNRVQCNQALADHPTVQVEQLHAINGRPYSVGALGLINGVLEPLTGARVAMKWSEKDAEGRTQMTGFCQYEASETAK